MGKHVYVVACLVLLSVCILAAALGAFRTAPPGDGSHPSGAAPASAGSDRAAEAERANRERLRSLGYLN